MSADERWVLTYEYEPVRTCVPLGVPVEVGRTLPIGRECQFAIGVEISDKAVSRQAIDVTATENGWDVDIRNLHGAMLHAWGQAPQRISGRQFLSWPRMAIRLLTGDPLDGRISGRGGPAHHWVLLEADMLALPPTGPRVGRQTTSGTVSPKPPAALSGAQEEALRLVFQELLQWPPRLPAQPMQLDAAGRRLGIGEGAVRERLRHVHDRALRLGLHRRVGLTNPDYLYVLVQAGYLAPPRGTGYRVTPSWLR